MAPKGSCKGQGKATARAKILASGINQRLVLDRDRIQRFISEHIHGPIWIYNLCGLKCERAWDLIYDIIFLEPVRTRHFSQFELMWLHHGSRCSPVQEWWAAFRSYMGQMFHNIPEQLNNRRWNNPMPSGFKPIASIRRLPVWGKLHAPVSISLGTVAMISG
jgi:hypothetical protein